MLHLTKDLATAAEINLAAEINQEIKHQRRRHR